MVEVPPMAALAQVVERQIVVLDVVGSSPTCRPIVCVYFQILAETGPTARESGAAVIRSVFRL